MCQQIGISDSIIGISPRDAQHYDPLDESFNWKLQIFTETTMDQMDYIYSGTLCTEEQIYYALFGSDLFYASGT